MTGGQLALISELKQADVLHAAGDVIFEEGVNASGLYTLLRGWALRFKTLPDGRRQVLNVMLPGDFIGLQQRVDDFADHGVQALTDVHLCVFERDAIWRMHRDAPELGYDLTWLVAREESVVDDNLLTAGRRTARERIAALIVGLCARARQVLPAADATADTEEGMLWPLTQQLMADAVGLSLIHTHRTLRQLVDEGLCRWPLPQRLCVPDLQRLAAVAKLRWPLREAPRPLI